MTLIAKYGQKQKIMHLQGAGGYSEGEQDEK